MPFKATKEKTAFASKDYGFNWTKWLDGATLAASEWDLVEGPDSALALTLEDFTDTQASVRASGGSNGDYTARNRITDSDGQTEEAFLVIKVRN